MAPRAGRGCGGRGDEDRVVNEPLFQRIWGSAISWLDRSRRFSGIDVLFVLGVAGLLFGAFHFSQQWTGPYREQFTIDLDSNWELVQYTFFSLSRGLLAYLLSLVFTLVYGYWAAKDPVAERVLVPLLDILQSIPVLGFLPGLVLALVSLFPTSNIGLELAAVIMIFTGQAWNMTFSYYHSLRSVPLDQREVATIYRFSWWQRLRWVELPFATIGLVWNSMMSMAGGWFFLMINEAFKLQDKDFRLLGLGSYMSEAVKQDRPLAQVKAILAMILMIVFLDQFLWRPVVAWAQKFRVEEGGAYELQTSWFLDWLRRSRILHWVHRQGTHWWQHREAQRQEKSVALVPRPDRHAARWASGLSLALFLLLVAALVYGSWKLLELLRRVSPEQWLSLPALAGLTLGRVLLAILIGTLWTLPAGLAIGLSPRLARRLQPVVQILASFPAPMLFPLVVVVLQMVGITLDWGSILLMLLGTQWYILFNVTAGAMAIPADLKEAAVSYRIPLWQKFRILYFPAVFPYLVTGWVTAAGGAWNTSIVSEYLTFDYPLLEGKVRPARGLGAQISEAFESNEFALLAASVLVMSTLVVVFNRTVWRWCYRLAEERYSLNK
jgi:NitT/TauT family transport system permease protein